MTRVSASTGMKFVSPRPARDDVVVQVVRDPGAGHLAQVHPDVEALGPVDRAQHAAASRSSSCRSWNSSGESVVELRQVGARDDHHVPRVVGGTG